MRVRDSCCLRASRWVQASNALKLLLASNALKLLLACSELCVPPSRIASCTQLAQLRAQLDASLAGARRVDSSHTDTAHGGGAGVGVLSRAQGTGAPIPSGAAQMVGRSVASMTSGGAPGANDGGDEVRGGTGMPQGKVPEVPHHLPAPRHSSGAGRQGQVPRDGMVNATGGAGRGAGHGSTGGMADLTAQTREEEERKKTLFSWYVMVACLCSWALGRSVPYTSSLS
jgi:hypothetical protein